MKHLLTLLVGLLEEKVVWITTKTLFGTSLQDKKTQQEISCERRFANSTLNIVTVVFFLAISPVSAFATEAEDEQLLGLWKSDENCFVHIYQTGDGKLGGAAWGQRKESAELSLTVGDDRRFPWKRKSKKSGFGDDGEMDPNRGGRFIVASKDRNILQSNFSPCFISKGTRSRWKRVDVSSIAVDKVPKWYQPNFQSSQVQVVSNQEQEKETKIPEIQAKADDDSIDYKELSNQLTANYDQISNKYQELTNRHQDLTRKYEELKVKDETSSEMVSDLKQQLAEGNSKDDDSSGGGLSNLLGAISTLSKGSGTTIGGQGGQTNTQTTTGGTTSGESQRIADLNQEIADLENQIKQLKQENRELAGQISKPSETQSVQTKTTGESVTQSTETKTEPTTKKYSLGVTLKDGPGFFIVTGIDPLGLGTKSGLKVYDYILSYDGTEFQTGKFAEWDRVFDKTIGKSRIEMRIRREMHGELTLTVDLRTEEERKAQWEQMEPFYKVLQTYDGTLTWGGGDSPVTTKIFEEELTLKGQSKYLNRYGQEVVIDLVLKESDLSKRSLIFQFSGPRSNNVLGLEGLVLWSFSEGFNSFKGTWGKGQETTYGGIWNGGSPLLAKEESYSGLKEKVATFEGEFKGRGEEILSRITNDYSNLEILESDLVVVEKEHSEYMIIVRKEREELKKKQDAFSSLEGRVARLEGDYKTQGDEILSLVKDDYSNLEILEMKLEVVEEDHSEYMIGVRKEKEELKKKQESFAILENRVEGLEDEFKTQGEEILSQVKDDYSNLDLLDMKLEVVEGEYSEYKAVVGKEKQLLAENEQKLNGLRKRVTKLKGDFKTQALEVLEKVKDDYSNLGMLEMKLEVIEEEYEDELAVLAEQENRYNGLVSAVKSFEKKTKLWALDVLARIDNDFSNLDEIVQEIDTLQKRSDSEKEYKSLRKQVRSLEGDFKRRGVVFLSEIADDFSNLGEIRDPVLQVIAEYEIEIDNKNIFECLREQISTLEGDFKKKSRKILMEVNDDFSNIQDLSIRIGDIVVDCNEYRSRKDKVESANKLVAVLDGDFKSKGEGILSQLADDLSNVDSISSQIEKITANYKEQMERKSKSGETTTEVDTRTTEELTTDRDDNETETSSIQVFIGSFTTQYVWDGGGESVETEIFLQENDLLEVRQKDSKGYFVTMFFSKHLGNRELVFHRPGGQHPGYELFRFSEDYLSFEGTFGYGESFKGVGTVTGRRSRTTKEFWATTIPVCDSETKTAANSKPGYGDGDCPEGTKGFWACNAETYAGDKKDGVPHGTGKFTWKGGQWYQGEVADGFATGSGTFNFNNGLVYVGESCRGSWHGMGTVYHSGNLTFSTGVWKNDKLLNGVECDGRGEAVKHWVEGDEKQVYGDESYNLNKECSKEGQKLVDGINRENEEVREQAERERKEKEQLATEKRKKEQEQKEADYKKNKPTIDLASAYDSYLWVKGCYEAREGYAVGFIVENQMGAAKEQIRAVQDAITSQHPTIDSDRVWKSTVKSTGDVKWIVEQGVNNDWKTTEEMCGVHKFVLEQFAKEWGAPVEKKKDF
jgi:hypothetical protein